MKGAYLPQDHNPSKSDYQKLLCRCGFGVPDLDRAALERRQFSDHGR